jgi:hypothetical protein
MTPLRVRPGLLAQMVVLPLLMCGLLLWGKPLLLDFWRACILFWAGGLDLPFTVLSRTGESAVRLYGGAAEAFMPGTTLLLATTAVTLAAFALSFRLNDAWLPLKYPIWIVCGVQTLSLVYFWLTPAAFAYSIARHCEELMTLGFAVMLTTPFLLAMGYYVLNQKLGIKLLHTALILLFLAIMIPHQVVAQALVMQHFSLLFMPVLYICFGVLFDALVLVALYSWAVSKVPAHVAA